MKGLKAAKILSFNATIEAKRVKIMLDRKVEQIRQNLAIEADRIRQQIQIVDSEEFK